MERAWVPGQVVYINHGKAVIRQVRGLLCEVQYESPNREGKKEWVNMAKATNIVVAEKYRDGYKTDKSVRTPSGAYSISKGDDVAKSLNGLSTSQLAEVAKDAGVGEKFAGWKHLNPGMQRMNLGNMLRGLLRQEDRKVVTQAAKAVKRATSEKREYKPKEKVVKTKAEKKVTQTKGKAAPGGMKPKTAKEPHRDEKVSRRVEAPAPEAVAFQGN